MTSNGMPGRNEQPDDLEGLLGPLLEQARYDRGAQVLAAGDREGGQRVVDALADVAPALAHHVVAYGFGEVYARPGLTPPQRQLVTLGVLNISAALNVGPSLSRHRNHPRSHDASPPEPLDR